MFRPTRNITNLNSTIEDRATVDPNAITLDQLPLQHKAFIIGVLCAISGIICVFMLTIGYVLYRMKRDMVTRQNSGECKMQIPLMNEAPPTPPTPSKRSIKDMNRKRGFLGSLSTIHEMEPISTDDDKTRSRYSTLLRSEEGDKEEKTIESLSLLQHYL